MLYISHAVDGTDNDMSLNSSDKDQNVRNERE